MLLRAVQSRVRKRGRVRIAERAAYRIRLDPHLEPLQQSLGLRVIGEHLVPLPELDGYGDAGEDFDRIAGFQTALTHLAGGGHARELPEWRRVTEERIVQGLRDLVGECCDVLETAFEDSWRDPAGIVEQPPGLRRDGRF